MTVGELIAKLKDYPQDMPVLAQWESVYAAIHPSRFEMEIIHERDPFYALVINLDIQ